MLDPDQMTALGTYCRTVAMWQLRNQDYNEDLLDLEEWITLSDVARLKYHLWWEHSLSGIPSEQDALAANELLIQVELNAAVESRMRVTVLEGLALGTLSTVAQHVRACMGQG